VHVGTRRLTLLQQQSSLQAWRLDYEGGCKAREPCISIVLRAHSYSWMRWLPLLMLCLKELAGRQGGREGVCVWGEGVVQLS
jgi:hypothetical protein